MEAAVKDGKSAGVDNIPAELVQAGGEAMIDILTSICNKIWKKDQDKLWKTGEWPTIWTQSLVITLPKERQFAAVPELQNHQPYQLS